jgi:integrase
MMRLRTHLIYFQFIRMGHAGCAKVAIADMRLTSPAYDLVQTTGHSKDEMTGQGFRSSASTLLNESGKWSTDAIERALAHGDTDHIRAAYHRGTHWSERVAMASWWSDYLDALASA